MQQVTDLLQKIDAKKEGATSIAGDFNAVPGAARIGLMQRTYKRLLTSDSAYTFPSDKPRSRFDYIFLSAEHRWKVLRQEVLKEATASDHRPVPGTVKLKTEPHPSGRIYPSGKPAIAG